MTTTSVEHDASHTRIARISLPMALSNAIGTASQLVVTGLIGRLGEDELYIRSVYTPIAFLVLALTTGLAVTLQVVVAQAFGRGDKDQVPRYMGSVARSGIVLFLALGALLIVLSGVLADAVQVVPGQRGEFRLFLAAMVGASVLGMLGEICSAALRGLGRGGVAAITTGLYVGLNIAAVAVGGLVLDGGLMAVPLAAALAGAVEVVICLAVLVRAGLVRLPALTGWRPETPVMLRQIGAPVAASFLVLVVVNFVLLRIVAPAGQLAVAGFSVGYMVQTAIVVPAVGFASGVAVLMNQALAAGRSETVRLIFRRGMVLGLIGYAVLTVLVLSLADPLTNLLAGSPDVAEQARRFVDIVGVTFGCTGMMLIVLTVMEQVGHARLAMIFNAGYFALIVTVGWALVGTTDDVSRLYWTMATGALLSLLVGVPYASRFALRPKSLHPEHAEPEPTPEADV
ncbi:MATE family efflux transporter [Streptomyces sp. NPDC002790]|uniref:MATE family efflux transporter n=1 Tax=Streptomyces sp. NPDC002790 TaxID=3154431 RepID=UPI003317F398